jgi:hypothetical protein
MNLLELLPEGRTGLKSAEDSRKPLEDNRSTANPTNNPGIDAREKL